MVTNTKNVDSKFGKYQNGLFMILIGLFLGLVGGLVQRPTGSVIWAAILIGIWGAYDRVASDGNVIMKGIIVGGGLGTAVGLIGWWLGGSIQGPANGALFGLLRGILVGTAVGIAARAKTEERDTQQIKILIVAGSIVLGMVLGGLVGLTAGLILGIIGQGLGGAVRASLAGAILGAAVGSYFRETKWVALGAALVAVLAAASALSGGASAGIVIGAISGSFAPILLVGGIGAFGGLTSRGLKAMFIEALEAPIEMMEQGAVAFLAPALIIGTIVGSLARGQAGIIGLTITFALLGLFFGIFREISGSRLSRVTVQSMVETAMLGAEEWPIGSVIQQIRSEPRRAAIGAVIGVVTAVIGGVAGALLAQLLLTLPTTL